MHPGEAGGQLLLRMVKLSQQDEGLAVLVRRDAFDDVEAMAVELEPSFCDRVAIFTKMRHRASGRQMMVVTGDVQLAILLFHFDGLGMETLPNS